MSDARTLETIGIEPEEGWTAYGRINLIAGKLEYALEELPDRPGLYRLGFDPATVYFGEAGDLRRRVGDYLQYYDATGIESEFRINRAIHQFRGADVAIVTGDDLQTRSQRCTIESRLIKLAKASNTMTTLNGGSIPDRISFHAAEIIRLSTKLKKSEPKSEEA